MRYTTLGNTDLSVSILGFGCMRLPERDGKVVRELSTPLLQRAVELGINYFDTAVDYCHGDSQAAVGEALEGVRDKLIISTKNHQHRAGKKEWRRYLEESLELLRTDYIDLYSHHGISWEIFTRYLDPAKGGLTREMMRAKEEGLIRHMAFSFHDEPENLIKLINTGLYESVTLQYNLLDQRNRDAILHARERGMGVVIMGPVGGGRLGIPSKTISHLAGGVVSSTPEAALRFVWGTPGVDVALSGMQDLRMLEENVRIALNCEPFSGETITRLNELVADRKQKSGLYCTGCGYCTPECPEEIAIPENLDLLNLAFIYDLYDEARERYRNLKGRASGCVDCGRCIVKCPQKIDIPKQLRKAGMIFDAHAGTLRYDAVIDEVDPEGHFTLSLKVFNFSEDAKTVDLRMKPADGITVKPDVLEIRDLPPFARLSRKVQGSFAPRNREIALRIESTSNRETVTIDKASSFAFVYKGVADDWESGEWQRFRPSEDDFDESKETAAGHRVRFKLSYDEKNLLLFADVKDDFLFPTVRKTHRGDTGDCLELFLDGGKHVTAGDTGRGDTGRGEGVCRIFLYPGTPGKAPPFYKAPRTDMAIKLSAEKTDSGYRIRAGVPFRSFCAEDLPPKKIGIDLACHTADRDGARIGRFSWAGESVCDVDPSRFRWLWLV